MKKLFSLLLSVAMIAAMAIPAFATDLTETPATGKGEGSYNLGVNGTYQAGAAAGENVTVDIAWGGLTFTYTAGGSSYDPGSHTTTTEDGKWSTDKGFITATNHSNVGVTATFSFAQASTLPEGTTITGTFYNESVTVVDGNDVKTYTENADRSFTLLSGEKTAANSATYTTPKQTIYFGIDSASSPITGNVDSLGTITVTISKATIVTSQSELEAALAKIKTTGGTVTLGSSFALTEGMGHMPELLINGGTETSPIVIDLNGYTLSGGVIGVTGEGSYVTIKNGAVTYSSAADLGSTGVLSVNPNANLAIKNVTVNATGLYALSAPGGGTVTVTDSTLNGGYGTGENLCTIFNDGGTFVFSGSKVVMDGKLGICGASAKVILKKDTECDFDGDDSMTFFMPEDKELTVADVGTAACDWLVALT